MADTGSKLALALSKAQGMMKAAKKDMDNPFFKSKYADLASVWDACREALSQNEIAVMQVPELQGTVIGIRTKLIHSSGEYEEGFFPLAVPVTAKAQEMGSAMTYLRRYALSAMVGVAPEDDDGNGANATGGQKIETKPESITAEQEANLVEWIETAQADKAKLLEAYKVAKLSDLSPAQYQHAIGVLKKKAGQ
jgi:hypothetical protein